MIVWETSSTYRDDLLVVFLGICICGKKQVKIHHVININLSKLVVKLINAAAPDERLVKPDSNNAIVYCAKIEMVQCIWAAS
jgi:hypothetical protein